MKKDLMVFFVLMVLIGTVTESIAVPIICNDGSLNCSTIVHNINNSTLSPPVQIQDGLLNETYQFMSLPRVDSFNSKGSARSLERVDFTLSTEFNWRRAIKSPVGFKGTTSASLSAGYFGPVDAIPAFPFSSFVSPTLVRNGDVVFTPLDRAPGVDETSPLFLAFDDDIGRSLQVEKFVGENKTINMVMQGQMSFGAHPTRSFIPFVTEDIDIDWVDLNLRIKEASLTYVFHNELLTRYEEDFFSRMGTGSPTSITQIVDTPTDPFNLSFDYLFETNFGDLTVMLGGTPIGNIVAPASNTNEFQSASFLIDDSLLGLSNAELSFTLDGPDDALVKLDNILFPSIFNGDFQFGDISGWTTNFSNKGFVQVSAEIGFNDSIPEPVPEPATLFLLGTGLIGVILYSARNREHSV